MKLGVQVGLGPGHIVLDEDPAPPPPKNVVKSLTACINSKTVLKNIVTFNIR